MFGEFLDWWHFVVTRLDVVEWRTQQTGSTPSGAGAILTDCLTPAAPPPPPGSAGNSRPGPGSTWRAATPPSSTSCRATPAAWSASCWPPRCSTGPPSSPPSAWLAPGRPTVSWPETGGGGRQTGEGLVWSWFIPGFYVLTLPGIAIIIENLFAVRAALYLSLFLVQSLRSYIKMFWLNNLLVLLGCTALRTSYLNISNVDCPRYHIQLPPG